MRREEAYVETFDAMAKIQKNVSLMLGAKASEAEKVRNWLMQHIKDGVFKTHADRLATCLQIHEQQIEVIDGLTKLCNGLNGNMRVILHPDMEDEGDVGPFAGGFGAEDSGR